MVSSGRVGLTAPPACRRLHGGDAMATTSILQRNVDLARKGYEAFNKSDIETVMALITDDCVWHGGPFGPLAGDYKGKAAVMEFFGKFGQLTQGSYKGDIHDILASEEHTVVLGTATITRNGKTRKDKFVDTVHPDSQGRVKEFWRFFEDPTGLEEFLKD
jgi:uncharacterized protein